MDVQILRVAELWHHDILKKTCDGSEVLADGPTAPHNGPLSSWPEKQSPQVEALLPQAAAKLPPKLTGAGLVPLDPT